MTVGNWVGRIGEVAPDVAHRKAMEAAWSAYRDQLDAGLPVLAVLRHAVEAGDTALLAAVAAFGASYLATWDRPGEMQPLGEALATIESIQEKARREGVAALDKLAK